MRSVNVRLIAVLCIPYLTIQLSNVIIHDAEIERSEVEMKNLELFHKNGADFPSVFDYRICVS